MDALGNSENQSPRVSARWDDFGQLRFAEACELEMGKGNREGVSFTRHGWKNIHQKFNRMTGRNYSKEQLRNHWDVMRREWLLYEDLVKGQTEIRWDTVRNTIVADENWWNERIKANKLFRKFKGKDLSMLKFKYAPLFSGIGATPAIAWTPSQLSHHEQENSVNLDMKVEVDLHPNESSGWCDGVLNGNVSTPTILYDEFAINGPGSGKRRATSPVSGLQKRISGSRMIWDPVKNLVNLVEDNSSTPSAPLIRDCIQILYSMDGIEEGTKFHGYALNLFKDPDNREIFVSIPTVFGRLNWLKYNFELSGGKL